MKNKFVLLVSLLIWGISIAQVGVGNNNPKVNLDARTSGNSAIAFGDTNQTATIAGEGAMKYDTTTKQVYYSDGTSWMHMAGAPNNAFIPKVVAAGKTTVVQNTLPGGAFYKWNFGSILADDGNWSAGSSIYTIPVSGFYQFSLAGGITSNKLQNTSNLVVNINDSSNTQAYVFATTANFAPDAISYKGGTIVLYINTNSIVSFGSTHCNGCNNTGQGGNTETYSSPVGATFSISFLGS
ncbi:hypothetical protein [Chryseobacterium sp. PMSZPI]|uniref:hypothetical protein n=1 Tax=Chryseobacterium sp. PMSZPI TaxID=1033900 RepID=UPI000C33D158|nr:hypothetical protein [Chryseobacterium sp. PMSZPI]PKF73614.1 hypothetical protein CW752_13715 [Chryseobacterium sp. PMSZPI]